jgi:UDP-N-acetyl-D-glucosamine dehydrogenase
MNPITHHAPGAVVGRAVPRTASVAVLGLGYVGLPTSLALTSAGVPTIGIDISADRLAAITAGDVDLLPRDHARLDEALADGDLTLSGDPADLAAAEAVIIAVPTPVDADLRPDLRALRAACATVVANARAGQTIILTSTTYVGTTRELLVEPLAGRGLVAGAGVHVAFAPERINPGDDSREQNEVPRVVGGVTEYCTRAAMRVLLPTADHLHPVSSPEAAELTKLYENTFRAVNLAFANEMATVARHYGLDPIELVDAAATKPYGFLAHYPSAGIGGHCIPVDPYYMLTPLREAGVGTAVATAALGEVAARPARVAARALDLLDGAGVDADGARILIVGMAYKPGIADYRESPAAQIAQHLASAGATPSYHDPLVPAADVHGLGRLESVTMPSAADYDLALVATVQPGHDYGWLDDFELVLDATYRTPGGISRHLV